jgi:hypothetical protein
MITRNKFNMKYIRQLVRLLGLVGLVLVVFNNSIVRAQQDDTVVRCRFESTDIGIGAVTILYLEVVEVTDLFAFQLEVTFNPEYVDVFGDRQEFDRMVLGDFLSADNEIYNVIHRGYGGILMAIAQNEPTLPRSGSGELARGYVSGKQAGVVDFVFEEVILMNSGNEEISYRLENCSLTISASGQVTETPTITSTPTHTQQTPERTLTPGATQTSSPTMTAQPSFSPSPELSETATSSPIPQISETTTSSPIPQISATPTESPQPLPSILPTSVFSPTPLPSIAMDSETPFPSYTPTVTVSPTGTATLIPEPTPRPINNLYVALSMSFCLAMFAVIAIIVGVIWYLRQSQ